MCYTVVGFIQSLNESFSKPFDECNAGTIVYGTKHYNPPEQYKGNTIRRKLCSHVIFTEIIQN